MSGVYQNFQLRLLDGWYFNNYNNTMISRIAPFCQKMLPIFAVPNLFYFSTETTTGQNPAPTYKSRLLLQDCLNVKDVLLFLGKPNLSENQKLQAVKRFYMNRNTAKPWERYINFVQNIESINTQEISAAFISDVCGVSHLVPGTSINYQFFCKIEKRINQLLQKPELLTDENIINFSSVAIQYRLGNTSKKVDQILAERIKNIKIKDFQRYLEVSIRNKNPNFLQRQILSEFCEKLNSTTHLFTCRILSLLYYHIRQLNPKIWGTQKTEEILKETIKSKLYELDEKQIGNVIYFQNELNVFHKLIYIQLLDSIEEEGTTQIDKVSFFKILNKLYLRDHYWLSAQREAKFLKFLSLNLDNTRNVVNVIEKDLLSFKGKTQLIKLIQESEYSRSYNLNYFYVYRALLNGRILQIGNLTELIEKLENNQRFKINHHEMFVIEALIVDLLATQNPKDERIQSLHEKYKLTIKTAAQKNPNIFFEQNHYVESMKLLPEFKKRYGSIYLNQIMEEQMNSTETISNSRLNYLMATNSIKEVMNLLKKRKNSIKITQLTQNLTRVCLAPTVFQDRFNFINQLGIELLKQPTKQRGPILNYLCNFEVHATLKASEISNFLKFAQSYIKNIEIGSINMINLISYFIASPSNFIKYHPGYVALLKTAMGKLSPENCPVNRGTFFNELIKFNIVTPEFAKAVLQSKEKNKLADFTERFCQVVINQKIQLDGLQINAQNLMLIVKCKNYSGTDLVNIIPEIKEAIKKIRVPQIETILINFNLRKSREANEILNELFLQLNSKIENRDSPKAYFIMDRMRKLNFSPNGYKEYLKKLSQYYTNYARSTPLYVHELLVQECMTRKIKCPAYLNKLMQFFHSKTKNNEMSIYQYMNFIEPFTCLNPAKMIQILTTTRALSRYDNHKFFDALSLIDFSLPNSKQLLLKLLNTLKQINIYEGVYQYLLAHIPEIQQLKQKIKIKQFLQIKWLRELIIKYCGNQSIPFERNNKFGHEMIKIDNKYLCFTSKEFSDLAIQKLQKYYRVIFDLPESETSNIVVFFCKNTQRYDITRILSTTIPSFKDRQASFLAFLKQVDTQKQNKNENKEAAQESVEEQTKTN